MTHAIRHPQRPQRRDHARPGHPRAGDRPGLPQARPARHVAQPGDVRRRDRLGADHRAVAPRLRSPARAGARLRAADQSSGCGSPCCSPTSPKPWPKAAARRRRRRCGSASTETMAKRAAGDRRQSAPDCSRSCRRPTLRAGRHRRWSRPATSSPRDGEVIEGVASVERGGDHRRIGAGHPRERRRPLGGHRRHPGAVRPDHGAHHRSPGPHLPRPHDRAGRRRDAAEDAERDRAQHPARRADDHLRARGRDDPDLRRLCRRRRCPCWCWSRCS